MSLLALTCPVCADALPAGRDQRVLVCARCARTWAVPDEGDRLVPQVRTLVRPQCSVPEAAEIVLLPMWLVHLHVESMPRAPRAMASEIRIPAVGMQRLPLLLHFARNLTRAPLEWQQWENVDVPVEPAEVTAADAYALAETVVLRHVEGWPDDASLAQLQIPLGAARLVDWPCARLGSELIELVGGLSTQRALADAAGLRDRRAALSGALGPSTASLRR